MVYTLSNAIPQLILSKLITMCRVSTKRSFDQIQTANNPDECVTTNKHVSTNPNPNRSRSSTVEATKQRECSICLDPIDFSKTESFTFTPCFHVFHTSCLDTWLDVKGTCPSCRYVMYDDETDDGRTEDDLDDENEDEDETSDDEEDDPQDRQAVADMFSALNQDHLIGALTEVVANVAQDFAQQQQQQQQQIDDQHHQQQQQDAEEEVNEVEVVEVVELSDSDIDEQETIDLISSSSESEREVDSDSDSEGGFVITLDDLDEDDVSYLSNACAT